MKFGIEGQIYNLNTLWEQITLAQAVAISKVDIDTDLLEKLLKSNEIEYEDGIMKYCRKVISILSDAPELMLDKLDDIFIIVLIDYVKYIIHGLYYMNLETYKPIGLKSIKFKGIVYNLPESLLVNNEEILCYKEPSKHIIEVSNIMGMLDELEHQGIELMNLVCAIYLKEEGEVHDDHITAMKSEIFKELPMSVVWEVFFFTYYSLINYVISLKIYSTLPERLKATANENLTHGYTRLLTQEWQERLSMLNN